MILTKAQYDEMIDEDPFPFYKYDRLSEEEKMLSYLTMNGNENEDLASAIANFGPQPFRGTYGTNFQPPGFERNARWYNGYNYPPGQGPAPPSGLLPPGLHLPGQQSPNQLPSGLNPHALGYSSPPAPPIMPCPSDSLPGPSFLGSPRPSSIQTKSSPQFNNAVVQSSQPGPNGQDDVTAKSGYEEIPVPEYASPKTPAHRLLIVGGGSSEAEEKDDDDDDDDQNDNETGRLRQSELERIRSKSSDSSHESIEMTSGRVSLTSSRTTPPKA